MLKFVGIGIAIVIVLGLGYWFAIRPWQKSWGSAPAEVAMLMPGDDLVSGSYAASTRAITIHASAAQVYPWLLQLGQGRGGLYSYDALENLVGCDIHSVDQVIPALQNPTPDTQMRLGPWPTLPYYRFVLLIPNQAVILRADDPVTHQPSTGMWMFILQAVDRQETRMIVRHREVEQPGVAGVIFNQLLIEPISFVMEQKMMRGIRDRAEKLAAASLSE